MTAPYARGAATFMDLGFLEHVLQFKEARGEVMLVAQKRNQRQPEGGFFYEKFRSEDIPENPVIRTRLAPMLPRDDLSTVTIFIQTTTSEQYSKQSARSRSGVEDPLGEANLIEQEKARANPINEARRGLAYARNDLKALREDWKRAQRNGEDEKARGLEVDLEVGWNQYHALEVKLLGGPLPPFQQASPQGIPPEVQPPELGPDNPDQAAFAEGRAPYMGGRPRPPALGPGAQ